MRAKGIIKRILLAGVAAGSGLVIAACYGAYYGAPRTPPNALANTACAHESQDQRRRCIEENQRLSQQEPARQESGKKGDHPVEQVPTAP